MEKDVLKKANLRAFLIVPLLSSFFLTPFFFLALLIFFFPGRDFFGFLCGLD